MHSRSDSIDDFLARSGWSHARRAPLAGDASFRRYERVFKGDKRAVLMDAPPAKEDVRPFVHAGEHLLGLGLSAPKIYARDVANGFLLLEDLGDDLFTKVLRESPKQEEALYLAAADVLIELYKQAGNSDYSGFAKYDETLLVRETNLLTEWFLPAVMENSAITQAAEFQAIWQKLLAQLPALQPTLVLRDYHADNLLWLPEREGLQKVGLLDFQDGVIGSPAYDMVSFLEDARRDVGADTMQRVLSHYLEHSGIAKQDFMAAYALLGAQRNCKIVGIFARLAVRDGKRQYLSFLPRVWSHLERDLQHPLLKPLADWMEKNVPPQWRGIIALSDGGQKAAL